MNNKNRTNLNFGNLIVIGLNHKTAPVETRELFSLPQTQLSAFYDRLSEAGAHESVYVSTCNRVEVYMTAEDSESVVENIKRLMEYYTKFPHEQFMSSVYAKFGIDAVKHLFSVSSSLDSMVIGENEIVGQIKESYRRAVECGTTGIIMNRLFHRAFATSKRVRTKTDISKNPLSIASIAVEKAKSIFSDISSRSALLIGAGEMGELILKYLVKENLRKIIIANRTIESAERICMDIDYKAEIINITRIDQALSDVDIVISSVTAPHHVITGSDIKNIMFEREGKPICLIDIAVPRNIEPSVTETENVYLYNIDNLKSIADTNMRGRMKEIEKANSIIDEDIDEFISRNDELLITPTIAVIKNKFNEIRENELKKYKNKKLKHLSDNDFRLIEELTFQIMNKTLHNPIMNLKKQISGSSESESDELKMNTKFLEDIFTK
ncbi:MAG: glutamyl-tRNA reductase [Spirochaetes bacterium]|nr:glutamyl-tRNA reductase [Spirochaetota bacterium]